MPYVCVPWIWSDTLYGCQLFVSPHLGRNFRDCWQTAHERKRQKHDAVSLLSQAMGGEREREREISRFLNVLRIAYSLYTRPQIGREFMNRILETCRNLDSRSSPKSTTIIVLLIILALLIILHYELLLRNCRKNCFAARDNFEKSKNHEKIFHFRQNSPIVFSINFFFKLQRW